MSSLGAGHSGTFKIGNTTINRIGYGAMRITGRGVWGPPADRQAALATLRRLPELGVNFIDTADSYGPDVSEQLIREVLHPYKGLLIATKAGLTRPGPDQWIPNGHPAYLIARPRAVSSGSASTRSISGSFTASTHTCRATNNSAPSANCWTRASSAMRG
jgi:pyridoxine 4-dehydrogenase